MDKGWDTTRSIGLGIIITNIFCCVQVAIIEYVLEESDKIQTGVVWIFLPFTANVSFIQ